MVTAGFIGVAWFFLDFSWPQILSLVPRHNFLSHDWQTQGWLKVVSWLLSRCRDPGSERCDKLPRRDPFFFMEVSVEILGLFDEVLEYQDVPRSMCI